MRILLKKLIPVLVLFISTSAFAQYRIATVDLGRVFTNYWKTKQAQVAIDDKRSDIEKTGKDMMGAFNKAKEDYQKTLDSANDPAVSSDVRDKRKKLAEDKLRDLKDKDEEFSQFQRGAQATLEELIKGTRDKIVADIRLAITAQAKADGYTLVIDTASQSMNATPFVLYSVPGKDDLTDAVTKQINISAPVDTPKGDDKPASKTGSK